MTRRGPASIAIQRRIEWSDTDASGHYHYHTALRLLDAAEAALLDRLGLAGAMFGRIPRASVQMRYRRVLRFNDLVDVHLRVASLGTSSIVYAGEIQLDGETAAEGELVAVHVGAAGGSADPLPADWRDALSGAGPQPAERLTAG